MRKFFRKIIILILQSQAILYLRMNKPHIILILGEINRTDVKDSLLVNLRKSGLNARGNFKGYNSDLGLPLSILNLEAGFFSLSKWLVLLFKGFKKAFVLKDSNQILVLELAGDINKNIERFLLKLKPQTVILSDFLANYSDKICKSVSEIVGAGALILNADYEKNLELFADLPVKIYTFGLNDYSDFKALNVKTLEDGQEFFFQDNGRGETVRLNRFSNYAIYNYLISKSVMRHLKPI